MSGAVVVGEDLVKTYPDGRGCRTVLPGVSVSVSPGQFLGIRGPSGCGKSTLLNILAGLLRPDAGLVTLAGQRLDFRRPQDVAGLRRHFVGLIAQAYGLVDTETVAENVELPLLFSRPRPNRRERARRVRQVLDSVGLDIAPEMPVSALSGGEKQRVAIARALVRRPVLLVADEPTSALDAATASGIVSLLQNVARSGAGVVVASHDPRVIGVCDDVVGLDRLAG